MLEFLISWSSFFPMVEAITVFFMLSSISPLTFYFPSTSTCVSWVVPSCLLCLGSFSVIPRLLRHSLRLRARSHNFSDEPWSAILVLLPTLSFSPPLFEHVEGQCSAILHQKHCCLRFLITTTHNISLTVLLSLKFTFI